MAPQHNGMTSFQRENARDSLALMIRTWIDKYGENYGELTDPLMGILDTIDQERQADYAPNQP